MTARDWHADRAAVFERDAFTCRHCGTVGGDDELATLRAYPVGDVPLEGDVHESALVTVCSDCFEVLDSDPSTDAIDGEELFHLVRDTTRIQGGTISDVASFASVATSLPGTLETALGEETAAEVDETVAEYRRARRDVALAIDVVDARLARIAALETDAYDADTWTALEAFSETAAELQSTLLEVVALGETVATGLERCHGCFASLDGGTCGTCGLESRETADWQGEDGTVAFDRLFATINETLQGAADTTERLTERTTTLAKRLTDQ